MYIYTLLFKFILMLFLFYYLLCINLKGFKKKLPSTVYILKFH